MGVNWNKHKENSTVYIIGLSCILITTGILIYLVTKLIGK